MIIYALLIQTSVFPGTDRETKREFWGEYLFSKSPVPVKESLLLIYLNRIYALYLLSNFSRHTSPFTKNNSNV